jgi:hypothetical protein
MRYIASPANICTQVTKVVCALDVGFGNLGIIISGEVRKSQVGVEKLGVTNAERWKRMPGMPRTKISLGLGNTATNCIMITGRDCVMRHSLLTAINVLVVENLMLNFWG